MQNLFLTKSVAYELHPDRQLFHGSTGKRNGWLISDIEWSSIRYRREERPLLRGRIPVIPQWGHRRHRRSGEYIHPIECVFDTRSNAGAGVPSQGFISMITVALETVGTDKEFMECVI